jgi:transposase
MSPRRYQKEFCRNQEMFFPPSVDEYIAEENPIRAIDAYVDSLNLDTYGFKHSTAHSGAGQPPYAPDGLLKLYLYGYLNRIRSSRRLERETHRNIELFWLMKGCKPSYKTIASFRKDNPEALHQVSRAFVQLCKQLELFSNELVAIDGSFFKANASKSSIYTEERLERQLAAINRDIDHYLEQLNQTDQENEDQNLGSFVSDNELQEKIASLKKEVEEKQTLQKALQKSGETQISTVDPDARQLTKRGNCVAGYNVQHSVDAKHKLIVNCEVTQDGNDQNQLAPMALLAKETLGVEVLTVVADSGYFKGEQIKQCVDAQITPYAPEPDKSRPIREQGRYSRDKFIFDRENNRYTCPAGEPLTQTGQPYEKRGQKMVRYTSRTSTCKDCLLRSSCLAENAKMKNLVRWIHESVIETHRERMKESKEWMRQRASLAEHPFATLKRWFGMDHFLVRGLKKVQGEMSLIVLGYNLTRVINIMGVGAFIELMKGNQQAA